jgi:hypothetical protein
MMILLSINLTTSKPVTPFKPVIDCHTVTGYVTVVKDLTAVTGFQGISHCDLQFGKVQ